MSQGDGIIFRRDSMEREVDYWGAESEFQIDSEDSLEFKYLTQPTLLSTAPLYSRKQHNFKNFPKQFGNFLSKAVKRKKGKLPLGIRNLIKKRKQKIQAYITISDLREVCQTDEESKKFFQDQLEKEFFLDAIFSNKNENPISLVPAISNFYAAAEEPQKMISNQLMVKHFKQ